MRTGHLAAAAVAASAVALLAPAPIAASPGEGPTAAVSLGDSFVSGEGGRWLGNATNPFGDRSGTDRAAYGCGWWGCRYDAARVYSTSQANGCHRSDTAPIESAPLPVDERINLACSGARTTHVRRAAGGGAAHRDERPQADQLAQVARGFDVELVVLTVGANDLGFGGLVLGCIARWLTTPADDPSTCNEGAQETLEARMPATRESLIAALTDIRDAMRAAGYARRDYRLVVMGYASPLPAAGALRDPQSSWGRLGAGCPLWDADADWAARIATPWISATLAWAAHVRGAEFLDLRRALAGHELCHRASARVTASSPPRASTSEWVRAVAPGQGTLREAVHPNAYGQRAIGRCLGLMLQAAPGDWSCRREGPRIGSAYLTPAR